MTSTPPLQERAIGCFSIRRRESFVATFFFRGALFLLGSLLLRYQAPNNLGSTCKSGSHLYHPARVSQAVTSLIGDFSAG